MDTRNLERVKREEEEEQTKQPHKERGKGKSKKKDFFVVLLCPLATLLIPS